jgi:hypothetical protein
MNEGIFTLNDIFANQGDAYLLLVVFLILMISFWRFLNMDAER